MQENALINGIKLTKVMDSQAAAQTNRDSDIIDMQGYDGVMFLASFGVLIENGTLELVVDQNTANSTSGMAELTGTVTHTCGASDSESMLAIDVYKPRKRYLRCGIEIGTQNAEIDSVIAIQYGAHNRPITQSTDANGVLGSEILTGAAEA